MYASENVWVKNTTPTMYLRIYIQVDPVSADSVSTVSRALKKIWKIKEIKSS
jgi:hypothetical protein